MITIKKEVINKMLDKREKEKDMQERQIEIIEYDKNGKKIRNILRSVLGDNVYEELDNILYKKECEYFN